MSALPAILVTVLLPSLAMQIKPPSLQERLAAIGDTGNLPPALRRALVPGDDFAPVPAPGPDDWLANHREDGQTFDAFRHAHPNRPDERHSKLYLQPLGDFPADQSPPLERLRDFAAALFMLEVEVLPLLDIEKSKLTSRHNPQTGQRQLLTGDLLELLRGKLPADAYALLGITMVDLYPEPSWNFVFGQASLRDRVGVYSFARYDPRFYGARPSADWPSLLLRRSCKVLAHETAHMFGIEHCTYFHCLMNGSNHLAESDARPLHLCPVDLRKLHASVGFDVVERYRRLLAFSRQAGWTDESRWLARRLERITAADETAGQSGTTR